LTRQLLRQALELEIADAAGECLAFGGSRPEFVSAKLFAEFLIVGFLIVGFLGAELLYSHWHGTHVVP